MFCQTSHRRGDGRDQENENEEAKMLIKRVESMLKPRTDKDPIKYAED